MIGINDFMDTRSLVDQLRSPRPTPRKRPDPPAAPTGPAPKGTPSNPIGVPPEGARAAVPPTFRRGGRVKRTGWAKVHKGEKVLTAAASALGAGKKSRRRTRKKKA